MNIKHSPLCGRNFEYFSEDPVVAGELASALIQGIQSEGAGACIKHFAVNNQEERRMTISAEVSERALREIYLPAFEIAVKQADPVAVMCSYNRINGVYASENRHLLTEILREEWGYEGIVVTDWGAINDRVEGVRAGLDIEMPHVGPESDADIVEALEKGTLDEATLDAMVERILQAVYRLAEAGHSDTPYDRQADHELAREIEADSLVLLKNEPKVLPLDPATRIAFVGEFAAHPRYQGGGSSHIQAFRVADALHAAQKIAPVTYAQGYSDRDEEADRLRAEACAAAKAADVCVVFAGLPDAYESEGYDRRHLSLPARQNQLLEEIAKVQPNLVVVLRNGSPVTMPWLPRVPAVLEAYLGGQAVGEACVDVLFGRVTPSGHLAETFPLRLEDTPAYLSGSGEKTKVRYMEDVFVGYRYYDSRDKEVLFPFGHGLSYTTFGYSNLRIAPLGENRFTVSLDVENTGTVAGKEVVQLYVGNRADYAPRPRKELRNFARIALAPGEKKTVAFTLEWRDFCYYDEKTGGFRADSGDYKILVGSSSRDIRLSGEVRIETEPAIQPPTMQTLVGDVVRSDRLYRYFGALIESNGYGFTRDDLLHHDAMEGNAYIRAAFVLNVPLRSLPVFCKGRVTLTDVRKALRRANEESFG